MSLHDFIRAMPKVELHVHLEGSVRPETFLTLARKYEMTLPIREQSVEALREWYDFADFTAFVAVYVTVTEAMRTLDDLEYVTREFFEGQARQNILHSEITYTPYTHYHMKGWAFADQLAALNRARAWGERDLGVTGRWVFDIAREVSPEEGKLTAEWAISAMNDGCIALGLGGDEELHRPEKHAASFDLAHAAGLESMPHAGEGDGAESMWTCIRRLNAVRIGHGIRCMEDPALVDYLREAQIMLEVSPTSNVKLSGVPTMAQHPIGAMIAAGLNVSINSDDPPMFSTTLTDEYLTVADTFGYDADMMTRLVMNAVRASRLPGDEREALERRIVDEISTLRQVHGV